jgi:UDP-glucose 4-epimerase
VTGGAGFLGGYVVDELLVQGHQPLVFDHLGRSHCDVDNMLGDVRDATAVTELAAHCDGIIHLAAVLGTQETMRNPRPAAETNFVGGLNVLEALRLYDTPAVYIGVGNHWMLNPYAISKTAVESFVRMYREEFKVRCNIVRVVNAYGPRQRVAEPFGPGKVRKIMPALVCRALAEMPLELYGGGKQISDVVHASDAAHVLVRALEEAAEGNVVEEVLEVGPKVHRSVREVATLVADFAAERYQLHRSELVELKMRPGEQVGRPVVADTTSLKHIGVDPDEFTSLEDGLAETMAWYRDYRGSVWDAPEPTQ